MKTTQEEVKLSETHQRVVSLFAERAATQHEKGMKKYNTSVDNADLSQEDWLEHALEESIDLAVYQQRIIAAQRMYIRELKQELKTLKTKTKDADENTSK